MFADVTSENVVGYATRELPPSGQFDTVFGDMYIANVASADYGGAAQVGINNLGTTFGGSTGAGGAISGWTAAAVPEPTSGLLLLLGVAGLALRRRRA